MVVTRSQAAARDQANPPAVRAPRQPLPRWFLLDCVGTCPVVLKTRYVGHEAYGDMLRRDCVIPVPRSAEKVAREIADINVLDPVIASQVLIKLWEVCDPSVYLLDPRMAYELCLMHVFHHFIYDCYEGTDEQTEAFMGDVQEYFITLVREHDFTYRSFSTMIMRVLEWLREKETSY